MSLPKNGCMALAAIEEALAEQPAQQEGMTLRDYFAAKAMQGFVMD